MTVKLKSEDMELFDRIEAGEKVHESKDGNFGRELHKRLSEAGYKPFQTYSKCKVASFESHLQKGSQEVDILVSNFMGTFTQISVR